ncbi:Platelet-activating factor acetylhydrolase, isoform II [Nocardia farcinica]|uniref:Predicted dienelactone hydrolase n=1 Tax=Nocardia farcinica TaxID=37329 RepID=A0A0H5NME9_NOCFR|nr:alpha/beta fold hydrolase [Nocardia farcinica]AXK85168.1 alpha/beta fold hydrolase [Nocardia farcinica]CRY76362.1 Predicted dienelactone hydrolase [Nocardia farcinica]SIS75984.1 Platelet-activating factor acetylhydrolase, isoform II [Nocardia farcinica]VFA95625.1 Predicted dienelactone hydrolase [Nocardia farcinica]
MTRRRSVVAVAAVTAVATVAVAVAAALVFPTFRLPAPTGAHPVGTTTLHLVDTERREVFGPDPTAPRELMVQVWYPARDTDGALAPLVPGGTAVTEQIARGFGLPARGLDYLTEIPTHARENVPIADSGHPFPVVLLNHGYGSARFYHTSLAEDLAAHGYAVFAIDHTYSTRATALPGGRLATMRTDEDRIGEPDYRDEVGQVWTADVTAVLDRLPALNADPRFAGRLDTGRVGVVGHSFGGAAAYDAAYDPRVTTGIDLDGTLYRFRDRAPLAEPFLFVYSEQAFDLYDRVRRGHVYSDAELAELGASRAEVDRDTAVARRELEHLRAAARAGSPILYVRGTAHNNFMDQQYFSPLLRTLGLIGDIAPERAGAIVNDIVRGFLDARLRGGGLPDLPGRYPEIVDVTERFAG